MIEGHDYTIFSGGPGGRARMYALIALITAFLTPLAQHGILILLRRYWGDDWDVAETALFFGGFTTLILFGMLINVFNNYLWRTWLGRQMFRLASLPVPPLLAGAYQGQIEVRTPSDAQVFQTAYAMRIAQTWEQIAILAERQGMASATVRAHSDMASIQVGMIADVVTLRFMYTFEETLPRRDDTGIMTRQFTGTAIFRFSRVQQGWNVEGHFFDDLGRSGSMTLLQTTDA